jgi:hypothetical protein
MSLGNYGELKSSIANWLNRTDLTAEIPDFISLAESRIAHELRIPTIEKTISVTTNSQGAINIPVDFLELKDVFYNDKPMQRVSLSELRGAGSRAGTPMIFARDAAQFVFHPTPTMTGDDTLVLIYYKSVPALTDAAPANDLLGTAPELYLYGSLVEAATFLGSDSSRWEAGYQTALGRLMQHARSAEFSGATPQIASGY